MSYRVVIPTAGIGSRLGDVSRYINKSLVSIAHRPVISHLIEQLPGDCELVIALGHKGNLVREFLELAYPQRELFFVEVDPFEGEGSGLGFSLLCCEKYLQQPFVFLSCDTLVKETIPPPDKNWIGFSRQDNLSPYRTVSVKNTIIERINEKGDFCGKNLYAYIGLAGIKDYVEFWAAMHHGGANAVDQGEAYGLRSLHEKNKLSAHPFCWFDTGTPGALERTRAAYRQPNEPNILEKKNEAIWFVGNRVIKFSDDTNFISNRVCRAGKLSSFVPKISAYRAHMYSYENVEGEVLSKAASLPLFRGLLDHCKHFWVRAELTAKEVETFSQQCKNFYEDKTRKRVELFYQNFDKRDGDERINGETMPSLSSLFDRIDWDGLADGIPGRFHGDFHFENILWNRASDTFTFLDWRQDFGGDLDIGDIYYDLAKLLHGLIVSHELIAAGAFSVTWDKSNISFDLHRRQVLVECEDFFLDWCEQNGFNSARVKLITSLIYLNIAALHHFPYSLMLYALGKQMLKREVEG